MQECSGVQADLCARSSSTAALRCSSASLATCASVYPCSPVGPSPLTSKRLTSGLTVLDSFRTRSLSVARLLPCARSSQFRSQAPTGFLSHFGAPSARLLRISCWAEGRTPQFRSQAPTSHLSHLGAPFARLLRISCWAEGHRQQRCRDRETGMFRSWEDRSPRTFRSSPVQSSLVDVLKESGRL